MHPLALSGWIFVLFASTLQFALGCFDEFTSDLGYSLEFWALCLLCVATLRLQRVAVTSMLFFFECCFFVFIGGRLLSYPLMTINGPGSPFDLEFMAEYVATDAIKNIAFFYLVIFISFLNLGYWTVSIRVRQRPSLPLNGKFASALLLMAAIPMLFQTFGRLKLAFSQGYQAQYLGQTSAYQAGSGFLEAIYFVLLGIAYVSPSKTVRKLVLMLLCLHGLAGIASGARGQFLTVMALLLWLYGRRRKIRLWTLMLIFTALGVCANLLLQFSARATQIEAASPLDVITGMLWDQGVSLGVFSWSLNVHGYPLLAYVQTIFPGTAWVAQLISGHAVDARDLSFAAALSATSDPDMFLKGNGLGWSVLGDLALFSGGMFPLFALFSVLIGWGLRALDDGSRVSALWMALAVAIGPRLFFLPRASLSTIIPFLFYFIFIYWLLQLISGARASSRQRA
ncbi:O-antigen polysaccharide polymerase Wzy [Caballeronia fortuita]|nr:O-antigen polysaccharide polymerase Wzy [Caballeronia fortuita]